MRTALGRRRVAAVSAVTAALSCAGCGGVRMQLEPLVPVCRTIVPADSPPVRWISPFDADDRTRLGAWCEATGPIARYEPAIAPARDDGSVTVVSWNMSVGAGRLRDLVDRVRQAPDAPAGAHLVLLIQEAYRAHQLPHECPRDSGLAERIAGNRPDAADILDLARELGMYAIYAPSMRNGRDCTIEPREDRGNAILSTLPLAETAVIELPFAQQRRVAVGATVTTAAGPLHLVSVHLDTRRRHQTQAEGVIAALETLGWRDAAIVGGDFNSFLGPLDPAVRRMKRQYGELTCGSGPTHALGGRLDHLFVGPHVTALACDKGAERFGSDHHPLIARLRPASP